ncbi:3-hydroxybutyryl-CoA dehydrogenase [Coccomyxa sp. Obi]|nr:3-hydroxybutyryl-CoA dehydrogenase [Coccomyxa sp. Obi]
MSALLPKLLGIVGAGQMGTGIAQVAAMKGLSVILCDSHSGALERSVTNTERFFKRSVAKEKLTQEDAEAAAQRIKASTDLQALEPADFVVEAINEDESSKKAAFLLLDQIVKPEAILASNTSSISITRIAAVTKRSSQVVGMHFMNPVPVMPLVEIIRGIATSNEVFQTAKALSEHLGKTVCLSLDRPGFIVNRILMPMVNEAFYTLMEGVGTAEDIDKGMKLGTNHPMGPLQLADFIGLDTCLSIMRVLHGGTGDPKYRPCPLLVQYVDAGWLGKKVYKGVYTYAKPLN